MPQEDDKRDLRRVKRIIKKSGNRHRRRELQRDLLADPEGAAFTIPDLGRQRSDGFNGMDEDATRKRDG